MCWTNLGDSTSQAGDTGLGNPMKTWTCHCSLALVVYVVYRGRLLYGPCGLRPLKEGVLELIHSFFFCSSYCVILLCRLVSVSPSWMFHCITLLRTGYFRVKFKAVLDLLCYFLHHFQSSLLRSPPVICAEHNLVVCSASGSSNGTSNCLRIFLQALVFCHRGGN